MSVFKFKHFQIKQENSTMKVGTDSMILGSLIRVGNSKRALDIGTGTGVLSLMCAQKNKEITIDAIEIDFDSCQEAKNNVENSSFKSQINVELGDFLNHNFAFKYDLIFSNPPFFEDSLKSNEFRKKQARHTDSLPFENLFAKITSLLTEDGKFYLILPNIYKEKIIEIASKNGLYLDKIFDIYGNKINLIRNVFIFSKKRQKTKISDFIIRMNDGKYTNEYIQLTKDFHSVDLENTNKQ